MKLATFLMLLLALAFGAGCGDDKSSDTDGGANQDAGDDDNGEEGHDGDGDDEGEDHHAHDEKHPLGTQKVGDISVTVTLFGDVVPGTETHMDVDIAGGTPDAVRGWIGVKSGKGSLRAMIDGKNGHHHGHLEVPEELAADAALWIEVQVGKTRTPLSFKLPTKE